MQACPIHRRSRRRRSGRSSAFFVVSDRRGGIEPPDTLGRLSLPRHSSRERHSIMVDASRTVQHVPPRSRLERCLGIFADVGPGEGWGALLLAADIFCLLASYYLLKTARESLILGEGSAEVKSYAAGAQALILLAAVPLYGKVASRVGRSRLINGVLLFFVAHLVLFHMLATRGVHIGVAFFL